MPNNLYAGHVGFDDRSVAESFLYYSFCPARKIDGLMTGQEFVLAPMTTQIGPLHIDYRDRVNGTDP